MAQQWSSFAVSIDSCGLFSFFSSLAKAKVRQTEAVGHHLSSFGHRDSFVLLLHFWTSLKISSHLCTDTTANSFLLFTAVLRILCIIFFSGNPAQALPFLGPAGKPFGKLGDTG